MALKLLALVPRAIPILPCTMTWRKERYLKRHEKNESWNDPQTAGFYATHVLWNKPTLKESIADVNRKFPQVKVRLARNS